MIRALCRAVTVAAAITVVLLAVAKAYFHTWVVGTTVHTPPCAEVMTVKKLPAATGRDLEPGPVRVYAWYRDRTVYVRMASPWGWEIVPAPKFGSRYRVVIGGRKVDVYLGALPAPFTIVCDRVVGVTDVSVDYSRVEIDCGCSVVLLKRQMLYGSRATLPSFIINGKIVRGYRGRAHRLAIVFPTRLPVLPKMLLVFGFSPPLEVISIESNSGDLEVDGVRGIIRAKSGVTIRWVPITPLNFTAEDLLYRYPRWPYPL